MAWLLAWMGLAAAAFLAVGRSLERGVWEGYVTFGRAGSTFKPRDSREVWWLKSQGFSKTAEDLETKYHAIITDPYEQVYVRLRGEVSRKGQYGPLGAYQRVFYVIDVLDIRAVPSEDK